jgi:hypothetical protein
VVVKKLRVVLRWMGRTLLVLLAILVLFILEENIRGHITLARYKAELRARGEKLTLAELNLPKPTKSISGAYASPMTSNEFVAVYRTSPLGRYGLGFELFTSAGRKEVLFQQERLPDHRPRPLPPSAGRRGGRSRGEDGSTELPPPPPTCSWDELSKDIAAVSNVLERARTAATGSAVAAELDYEHDLGPQLTPLIQMLPLASWFRASALDALHQGNLSAALDDITTLTKLTGFGKGVREAGFQDLRRSLASAGLGATWEALQAEGWTDLQLARSQETWQNASCLPDYVPSIEMDRVTHLRAYDHLTSKDVVGSWGCLSYFQFDLADLMAYACAHLGFTSFSSAVLDRRVENGLEEWTASAISRAHWLVWRAAWVQQDEFHALRRWQDNMDGARAVLRQKSWIAWSGRSEPQWTFYDEWRYLLREAAYSCQDTMKQAAEYETLREMTIAVIALKRYQLRNGKFPSDLSALVPEFLPTDPLDWMDGKPLHYKLNPGGTFTLYSVGENGVDDGGDPNPVPPSRSFRMWDGRDAVWPVAATKEEVEAWKAKRLQRMRQRTGKESQP